MYFYWKDGVHVKTYKLPWGSIEKVVLSKAAYDFMFYISLCQINQPRLFMCGYVK